jgi:hypothetical protein
VDDVLKPVDDARAWPPHCTAAVDRRGAAEPADAAAGTAGRQPAAPAGAAGDPGLGCCEVRMIRTDEVVYFESDSRYTGGPRRRRRPDPHPLRSCWRSSTMPSSGRSIVR